VVVFRRFRVQARPAFGQRPGLKLSIQDGSARRLDSD
jgi:hypothetical protein